MRTLAMMRLRRLNRARHVQLRFILADLATCFQWSLPGQTCLSLRVACFLLLQGPVSSTSMASMSVSNGFTLGVESRLDRGVLSEGSYAVVVLERAARSGAERVESTGSRVTPRPVTFDLDAILLFEAVRDRVCVDVSLPGIEREQDDLMIQGPWAPDISWAERDGRGQSGSV